MNHSASLLGAFALSSLVAANAALAEDRRPEITAADIAFPIAECGLDGAAPSYVANHLVTVFDRSSSVDLNELKDMLGDVADAIAHPSFINGVEQTGPVAFSTVTFSSNEYAYRVLPTYIIEDEATALAASEHLRTSLASLTANTEGGGTDLGLAMRVGYGMAMACEDVFNPSGDIFAHNVRINVVSDFESGSNDSWTRDTILEARRVSHMPFVTISGFGLADDERDVHVVQNHMRDNIIGGPQHFSLTVVDGEGFGPTFRRKIILDIGLNADEFLPEPAVVPG